MNKLTVGITCTNFFHEDEPLRVGLNKAYVDFVNMLLPKYDINIILLSSCLSNKVQASNCDFVIFTGGVSIHPRFSRSSTTCNRPYMLDRDIYELDLLKWCLDNNIPVFGICRGHQLFHVFFGGCLYENVELEDREELDESGYQIPEFSEMHNFVNIPRSSRSHIIYDNDRTNVLHQIYQHTVEDCEFVETYGVWVNSLHEQGFSSVVDGFLAHGYSELGLIEFMTHKKHKILSVQYHPEELRDLRLLEYFMSQYVTKNK